MDNLQSRLDKLDPVAESYVLEKSRNLNAPLGSILKKIDTSKSKFYLNYDEKARAELDELARTVYRDTQFRALRKADEAAVEAMTKLISLMNKGKSEYVQLQAAQSLLAYSIGTPTQRVDVTSNGQTMKMYATVSPDDWDD